MQNSLQTLADERRRRAEVERTGQTEALKNYARELIALATERGDPARALNAADLAGIDDRQAERDLAIVREALEAQRIHAEIVKRENHMRKVEIETEAEETRIRAELAAVRARRSVAVSRFREAHQAGMALDRLQNQRPALFEPGRAVLLGTDTQKRKTGLNNLFAKN